jgi:hypothetical protein
MVLKMNTDGVASLPALTDTPNVIREANIAGFTITTGGVINITVGRVFCRPGIVMPKPDVLEWDGLNQLTIAEGGVTAAMMANRTRTAFVQATGSSDGTDFYPRIGRGVPLVEVQFARGNAGFFVPSDFVSGMSVRAVFVGGATGNAYVQLTVNYGTIGEQPGGAGDVLPFATVAFTNTLELRQTDSLSLSGVAAGDYLFFELERDGSAVQDTVSGSISLTGFVVTYTSNG